MTYPFTDDHEIIREAARSWLDNWYRDGAGPAHVVQAGFDKTAWQGFGAIQGFAGISVDEAYGGAGQGALGQAIILEEIGRAAFTSPFFGSCCLAGDLLHLFATDTCRQAILPRIASGQAIISVVDGTGANTRRVPRRHTNRLRFEEGVVSGTAEIILDAADADLFLLLLPVRDKGVLYLIDRQTTGLEANSYQSLDLSFRKGSVKFDRIEIDSETKIGAAALDDIGRVLAISYGRLAALCVGGAQRCLDMTLAYTAQRVQFDRPIASFQAIKHRCADMFVKLETARSAAYYAAIAPEAERYEAALIARAWCSEAYFDIAAAAIQLHGGIGFTWAYPLHYFFKQANLLKSFMGGVSNEYDHLSDEIGLVPCLASLEEVR